MPIDWKVFHSNRAAFPPEELACIAGQWLAWSFDGSQIVASSDASWPPPLREVPRRWSCSWKSPPLA
jgi:hypothetical protein